MAPGDSERDPARDSESTVTSSEVEETREPGSDSERLAADPIIYELPIAAPAVPGLSVIGEDERGAAGVTFSGWQSGGGRVRCLVSRRRLADSEPEVLKACLERLSRIDSAVVPEVTLFGLDGPTPPWLALVDTGGTPLTKVLSRHGIPRVGWSLAVMRIVAEALMAMHEVDVPHLDLRPGSIAVDAKTGRPRLTTLGLFQPVGPVLHSVIRSEAGSALGAASILAPEQLDPETFGELGQATDIYAFGATLYTLLSGTTPFTGGTVATILRKVVSEDPTPIGRIKPESPELLEALCVACLKKHPRERPVSMAAVRDQLLRAAGESRLANPPGPVSLTRVIQVIGDYRVVRVRERRGATVLYEVLSKLQSEPLALELGPVDSDDVDLTLQRQRELVQRIENHPHVLRIHDVGIHEGRRFTVTDLVEGRTLEDLLAEGPLDVRRAAAITRDIADALVFCHTYGVVHRGARPDLIIVDDVTGDALLTSIGRAPEVADEGGGPTTLVSKGLLFSTLFYFAPEQISATIGTIDGQTDVYVLGVTLYEMLTGRRPFSGSGPRAVLAAIAAGEPREPQALNPAVDGDLAAICLRALSVNKTERYLTAGELRADLERWLRGEPVLARPRNRVIANLRRLGRHLSISLRRSSSLVRRLLAQALPGAR